MMSLINRPYCSNFYRLSAVMLAVLVSPACSGGHSKSEWDSLDYSSVYKKAGQRENDPGYTPSAIGCLDDDLYNCN